MFQMFNFAHCYVHEIILRPKISHIMVIFVPVDCEDGDIQLVGGSSETEGTIQSCFNNQWGLIVS